LVLLEDKKSNKNYFGKVNAIKIINLFVHSSQKKPLNSIDNMRAHHIRIFLKVYLLLVLVYNCTNMRMVFKKSRSKYYLQLIDDLEFIHYVGAVNLENLAVCANFIGLNEELTRGDKIRWRLADKGFKNLEDAVRVYEQAFINGRSGFGGWNIKGLDSMTSNRTHNTLYQRMRVLEMLYHRFRDINEILSNEQIRKMMQSRVRNSSEEDWSKWLKELEKEDERLFSHPRVSE
jgi:hypothetical protein